MWGRVSMFYVSPYLWSRCIRFFTSEVWRRGGYAGFSFWTNRNVSRCLSYSETCSRSSILTNESIDLHRSRSRLGCQIRVTKEFNGIKVRIPDDGYWSIWRGVHQWKMSIFLAYREMYSFVSDFHDVIDRWWCGMKERVTATEDNWWSSLADTDLDLDMTYL
jgi:hypothetical protein